MERGCPRERRERKQSCKELTRKRRSGGATREAADVRGKKQPRQIRVVADGRETRKRRVTAELAPIESPKQRRRHYCIYETRPGLQSMGCLAHTAGSRREVCQRNQAIPHRAQTLAAWRRCGGATPRPFAPSHARRPRALAATTIHPRTTHPDASPRMIVRYRCLLATNIHSAP